MVENVTIGTDPIVTFCLLGDKLAAVVDVEAGLSGLGFYAAAVERVPGTVGGTGLGLAQLMVMLPPSI